MSEDRAIYNPSTDIPPSARYGGSLADSPLLGTRPDCAKCGRQRATHFGNSVCDGYEPMQSEHTITSESDEWYGKRQHHAPDCVGCKEGSSHLELMDRSTGHDSDVPSDSQRDGDARSRANERTVEQPPLEVGGTCPECKMYWGTGSYCRTDGALLSQQHCVGCGRSGVGTRFCGYCGAAQ